MCTAPRFLRDQPHDYFREGIMKRNLVVIGAGAGGGSVAAEAKRRDPNLSILMIEQGEHVSTAA